MDEERGALLQRAEAEHEAGNYEEAANLFKRILDGAPDEVDAQIGYSRALLENEHVDAAEAFLEPLKDSMEDGRLIAELARVYYTQQRFEDAVRLYENAAATMPDDGHVKANYGFALWQSGEHSKALETLKEALPAVQDDSLLASNMGQIYLQLGMWNEAVSSLERYLIDYPHDLEKRGLLALALDKAGWREEAETVLEEILTIDPTNESAQKQLDDLRASPDSGGDVEVVTADGSGLDGDAFSFGDAADPFVDLGPSLDNAGGDLGDLDDLGDLGDITIVEEDADPSKEFAEALLADVSEHLNDADVDGAIAYLESERATTEYPAEVLNLLGKVLVEDEDYEGAIAAFREAIEADPFHPQAHSNLGVLLWQTGEFEEAMDVLKKAIELDTTDMDARINLALICHQVGLYEDAVPLYTQYLDQFPENTEVRMELADCYVNLEELDAAIREVDTVLLLEPENEAAEKKMDELNEQASSGDGA